MASELLKILTVDSVQIIELNLPDGIDSTEFDILNAGLSSLFAGHNGRRWIVDLTGVEYLGSAALGLIVNIRQHIKTMQGKLALCHLSPALEKIFRTCCLERLFTITKTRADAIKAVR